MNTEAEKEYRERYLTELGRYELDLERWRVNIESVNGYATLAIKSLMTISGAAVVAMLAFIGHIATRTA